MAERMTDAEFAIAKATESAAWQRLQGLETVADEARTEWCAAHLLVKDERTAREIDRLVAEQIAARTDTKTTEGAT